MNIDITHLAEIDRKIEKMVDKGANISDLRQEEINKVNEKYAQKLQEVGVEMNSLLKQKQKYLLDILPNDNSWEENTEDMQAVFNVVREEGTFDGITPVRNYFKNRFAHKLIRAVQWNDFYVSGRGRLGYPSFVLDFEDIPTDGEIREVVSLIDTYFKNVHKNFVSSLTSGEEGAYFTVLAGVGNVYVSMFDDNRYYVSGVYDYMSDSDYAPECEPGALFEVLKQVSELSAL